MASNFPFITDAQFETLLAEAWPPLLEQRAAYAQQLQHYRASFARIAWPSPVWQEAPPNCPGCRSDLVEQVDRRNTELQSMDIRCRTCGNEFMADEVAEHALMLCVDAGPGAVALAACPACGLKASIDVGKGATCAWCGAAGG